MNQRQTKGKKRLEKSSAKAFFSLFSIKRKAIQLLHSFFSSIRPPPVLIFSPIKRSLKHESKQQQGRLGKQPSTSQDDGGEREIGEKTWQLVD
jgi:hypothetical protein